MMKGTSKTSTHSEEKKKKRKRGKIADNGEAIRMKIEEDSSLLVEKKKKSSNLKRKKKDKNLLEKQRPNVQVVSKEQNGGVGENSSEAQLIEDFKEHGEIDIEVTNQSFKSKKTKKKRKKEAHFVKEVLTSPANGGTDQDETYTISSGDEDCSKGMKKWIMEYHQSRPGLKALEDQIDDFITAHEEKLEEERKEREARAAEGGWTVVVHHKGRKKTTDSESGIVVGSVAQAAVEQKAARKKNKEVSLNFYRFQKKEAQRNEIMMLQSKFEEDKKRMQQLRAARKFRPH